MSNELVMPSTAINTQGRSSITGKLNKLKQPSKAGI